MRLSKSGIHFLFLNAGHFLDHFFLLIFATVAALTLAQEWSLGYAELIPYATPGFVAFGVGAIPAGWIADRWSREGMLGLFFIGIGITSVMAGFVTTPLQLGVVLTLLGCMAAIYHPVGLAMVIQGRKKAGLALAVNGVYGNLGVAFAALVTAFLIDLAGWQTAFVVPGVISIAIGIAYVAFITVNSKDSIYPHDPVQARKDKQDKGVPERVIVRVMAVVFITTAIGGLVFQSTTFALPKIFEETLSAITTSASGIGLWVFIVLAVAGCAQIVVGFLVDRMSVPLLFGIITAGQCALFAVMVSVGGYAAIVVSCLFMLLVFGQIPINDVMIGKVIKSGWRSRAFALRSFVTFTVMATAVPMIAWLHGGWGFSVLFWVLASVSLLSCVTVVALRGIPQLRPAEATA